MFRVSVFILGVSTLVAGENTSSRVFGLSVRHSPEAAIPCGTLRFSPFSDLSISSYKKPTSVPRANEHCSIVPVQVFKATIHQHGA